MHRILLAALSVALAALAAQAGETKNAAVQAAGVVREIDRPGARVKIDHGPIESIGMPAMVMTFKVKNQALLGEIKEGDRIDFTIERSGLGWVVVSVAKK